MNFERWSCPAALASTAIKSVEARKKRARISTTAALATTPLGLRCRALSWRLFRQRRVAEFVDPKRHSRAFGLFYTLGIGAGAVSPPVFGLLSDTYGVPASIATLGLIAFVTLPFCRSLSRSF